MKITFIHILLIRLPIKIIKIMIIIMIVETAVGLGSGLWGHFEIQPGHGEQ